MADSKKPESDPNTPWWSDEAPEDAPLPEGYPSRPDGKKVDELRQQLNSERAARTTINNEGQNSKFGSQRSRQAHDIGTYTLIPMIMLAGPIVGYGLGWAMEKQWGGAPWTTTIGLLMGVGAAFRQIFILLANKAKADKRNSKR